MRGQKSRSGNSTRPGFEGGQIPLYRRVPKLKGIAGGMRAGQPDHVVVNLSTLADHCKEGEKVSLHSLVAAEVLNISKKEELMGLKVLGDGDLPFPLSVSARAFSESARRKIEEAGGQAEVEAGRAKWTRVAHEAKHGKAKPKAKREARGEARGEAKGEAKGKARVKRKGARAVKAGK